MDQVIGVSRPPVGDTDESRQQLIYNSKLVELLNKLDETEIPIPPKDLKNAIPIPEFMKNPKKKAAEEEYTKKRDAFLQEIKSHLVCCKLWRRGLSWSKAYFERMIALQRVTTKDQAKRHEAIIQHFRDLVQQLLAAESGASARQMSLTASGRSEELALADEYLMWAEQHQVDTDNSLLGQHPTPALLKAILSREGLEEGATGNLNSSSASLSSSSFSAKDSSFAPLSLAAPFMSSPPPLLGTSPSAGQLRKAGLGGAGRPERDSIARRVVKRGDLVLAKIDTNSRALGDSRPEFVYARVAVLNPNANTYEHFIQGYRMSSRPEAIEVYTDPLERQTFLTKMILPLTSAALDSMGDVRQMEKLVQLPTDRLFSELQQWTQKRTFDTLQRRGIDTKFLDLQISKTSTIFELLALKRFQRKIEALLSSLEHNMMLDDIEEHARAKAREFRETQLCLPRGTGDQSITAPVVSAAVVSGLLYPPVARKVLQQLADYPATFTRMSEAWMQKYKGICTYGLDEIKLNQRDLMNGSLKNEMTKWWLDVIDTEVDQFLSQYGYDHEAVPYDYLETPPSDLEIVRRNLELIMRLLNELREPDKNRPVHELIRGLKAKIVPRMDSFIQQAQIVLTEHFEPQNEMIGSSNSSSSVVGRGSSSGETVPVFALSTIKQLFDTRAHSLDPTTRQWIKDMIADLEYLQEMKALEENPKIKAGGGFELGVVPITGLIVGRFVRYDNELRTVLEKFGRTVAPPDREPPHLTKQSSHTELQPASASAGGKVPPRDFPVSAVNPNSTLYQYAGANTNSEDPPPLPFAQLKELKEKERAAKKASWYKQDFSLFGNSKSKDKEKRESPYLVDMRYLSTSPPPPPAAPSPPSTSSTNSSSLAQSLPLTNSSSSSSTPSPNNASVSHANLPATSTATSALSSSVPAGSTSTSTTANAAASKKEARMTWVEFLMHDSSALNEVAPVQRGRTSRRGQPNPIEAVPHQEQSQPLPSSSGTASASSSTPSTVASRGSTSASTAAYPMPIKAHPPPAPPRMDVALPTAGDLRSPLQRPPTDVPPLPPMSAPIDVPWIRPALSTSSEPSETHSAAPSFPSSPVNPNLVVPNPPVTALQQDPHANAPPPSPEFLSPLAVSNVFSEAAARESHIAHSLSNDYLLSMERAMTAVRDERAASISATQNPASSTSAVLHMRTSSAGPTVNTAYRVDVSRSESPALSRGKNAASRVLASSSSATSPSGSTIVTQTADPMSATSAPVSSSVTPLSASPISPDKSASPLMTPHHSHSSPTLPIAGQTASNSTAVPASMKSPVRQSSAMASPSRLSGLKTLLLGKQKGKDP